MLKLIAKRKNLSFPLSPITLLSMRKPSLLIPYQGPDHSGETSDVFLYLRPETNGVKVESVLMRTIGRDPFFAKNAQMIYLANFPGDYIQSRHILEHHYSLKFYFAAHGKAAFTSYMRRQFEDKFSIPFDDAPIVGPFEAMALLGMDAEELFKIWVSDKDVLLVNGQTIKRKNNLFIVNYDMPALVNKNNFDTDIAVMMFRISFGWVDLNVMITKIAMALKEHGIVAEKTPINRVFHYSRGPFEQLLDGLEYLYPFNESDSPEEQISFFQFMRNNGYSRSEILGVIDRPLVSYDTIIGEELEASIYEYTQGCDYETALRLYKSGHTHIDLL